MEILNTSRPPPTLKAKDALQTPQQNVLGDIKPLYCLWEVAWSSFTHLAKIHCYECSCPRLSMVEVSPKVFGLHHLKALLSLTLKIIFLFS